MSSQYFQAQLCLYSNVPNHHLVGNQPPVSPHYRIRYAIQSTRLLALSKLQPALAELTDRKNKHK